MIRIETFYPFAVEQVWDALTDRESLAQWLMENDFRPQVGHKFSFRAKPMPGWNGIVDCEVLEVERPHALSYTWQSGGHRTTVTWTLQADQSGTRLLLEHTGFRGVGGWMTSKLMLGPGWKKMLKRNIPVILAHRKTGQPFPPGVRLVQQACH